jgi:hypothetical protein
MPPRPVTSLLFFIQQAVALHQTNPYQIAKATGLPLRSIQKLLTQRSNPTLRNVEVILIGLGYRLYVKAEGERIIAPRRRKQAATRYKRVAPSADGHGLRPSPDGHSRRPSGDGQSRRPSGDGQSRR